jgi:hypothetical protein
MSNEPKDPSGMPDQQAGGGDNGDGQQQKDSVSYDSHKKLLGEKKKIQAAHEEALKRLQSLEQEKLEAEGKKDELLSNYRKQIEELEGKYKSAVGNFAFSSVSGKFTEEALKQGCVDTEILLAVADLKSLDYDDNFQPDLSQIKMMVEEFKKNKPHLFQKAAPNVKDGIPAKPEAPTSYAEELKTVRTQKDLEEVMRKHGRI